MSSAVSSQVKGKKFPYPALSHPSTVSSSTKPFIRNTVARYSQAKGSKVNRAIKVLDQNDKDRRSVFEKYPVSNGKAHASDSVSRSTPRTSDSLSRPVREPKAPSAAQNLKSYSRASASVGRSASSVVNTANTFNQKAFSSGNKRISTVTDDQNRSRLASNKASSAINTAVSIGTTVAEVGALLL